MLVLRGRDKMTRSHALLHCPNATLAAAIVEAWEGRNPGRVRALLSNPRWESRLLRFLELSGVGRLVEGGVEEDEAHAARMDDWIIWKPEEERGRAPYAYCPFCLCLFYIICKGSHTPHSARWGWRIAYVLGLHAGAAAGFLCLCLHTTPSG
jgi:hypothetical protein